MPFGSAIKSAWLWMSLLAVAVLALVVIVLSGSKGEEVDSLANRLTDLKNKREKDLDLHKASVDIRKQEIKEAEAIKNKSARLKALADIANRRRGT